MLKPAVKRHLARQAGEPGKFYDAGGSSNWLPWRCGSSSSAHYQDGPRGHERTSKDGSPWCRYPALNLPTRTGATKLKVWAVAVGVTNWCIGVSVYRPLSAFTTEKLNDMVFEFVWCETCRSCMEQWFSENLQCILVWKCQTVAVLLLLSPCIHPVTHEETVILEENVV